MRWDAVVLVVCCLASVETVRADVVPPDIYDCEGRKAGDACRTGKCQSTTCARRDYSRWDRDASATPPTVDYECLRCVAPGQSVDPAPKPSADSGVSPSADSGAPLAGDGGTGPRVDEVDDEGGDGGCAVVPTRLGSHAAALAFAGTFGWLIARSRRRRG